MSLAVHSALSIIKVSQLRGRTLCEVKYSSFMLRFLNVLLHRGFIYGWRRHKKEDRVHIYLRYIRGRPAIADFKIFSSPGRQIFYNRAEASILAVSDPAKLYVFSGQHQVVSSYCRHRRDGLAGGVLLCAIW